MKTRVLLFAIVGGIFASLLTGLVSNTPAGMVGAVHYGYPLPWLIRLIIAPQYFPWKVDYVGFLFDVVVWALVAALLFGILARARKSSS
jgi:hypothetical protein